MSSNENKMNTTSHLQFKKQRIRTNPAKKWNLYEEKLLIEFLLQNRNDIERPTARIFYNRFSHEKKIDIEWQLARSKVRNMRISYFKTRAALETSTGGDEENRIIRKCNFYNELDIIFAHRYTETSITFKNMSSEDFNIQLDTDDTSTAASERSDIDFLPTSTNRNIILKTSTPHQNDLMQIKSDYYDEESFVPEMENEDLDMNEREEDIKKESILEKRKSKIVDILPTSSTNRKEVLQKTPFHQEQLMKIGSVCSAEECFVPGRQDEEFEIKERELFIKEKELQLEEKMLQLKEKKMISDENIKIHKINSREKLKIMEMEMKERLALEELKLKYK